MSLIFFREDLKIKLRRIANMHFFKPHSTTLSKEKNQL